MDSTTRTYDQWIGRDVYDTEGDKIGEITDVYYDDMTQRPEWLAVKTGFFGMKTTFVPIQGSMLNGEQDLQVSFSKEHVKAAPNIDPEGSLTADEEQQLWQHYGYDYQAKTKTSGFGYGKGYPTNRVDRDFDSGWREEWNRTTTKSGNGKSGNGGRQSEVVAEATATNQQVTTQTNPVRLRKYRWTEQVPVQREEVRVEQDSNR